MSKLKIWMGIIIGILIIIFIAYFSGYRIVNSFRIGKIGYVSITVPLSETSIFINESKKIITEKENEVLKIPLSPKKHSIIISHESYFPWRKDFFVPSKEVVNLSPIFVSQNPSGNIVTKNDPEYREIISNIKNNSLPTKDKTKKIEGSDISMWVEDNTIFVDKNKETFEVIKTETDIKNVDFYKNRDDSIIFSTSNGVYVVEIDKEGTQNFMPIYKGSDPYFVKTDPNYIYIIDSEALMQVFI